MDSIHWACDSFTTKKQYRKWEYDYDLSWEYVACALKFSQSLNWEMRVGPLFRPLLQDRMHLTKKNDSNHWALSKLPSVSFTLVVTFITWLKTDDGQ